MRVSGDFFRPDLSPNKGLGRGALSEYQEAWGRLDVPAEWDAPWQNPQEMYWTPDRDWLKIKTVSPELLEIIRSKTNGCFHNHNLQTQCDILEVPYRTLSVEDLLSADGNISPPPQMGIETIALRHFHLEGWIGERFEGSTIKLMLLFLEENAKDTVSRNFGVVKTRKNSRGQTVRSVTRTIEDLMNIKAELDANQDSLIANSFAEYFPAKLADIYKWWEARHQNLPLPKGATPDLFKEEDFIALSNAIGREKMWEHVKLSQSGFGGSGWPDLTLAKNGQVKFVEVKLNSDKFTWWQPYWIRNVARQLGLDVSVLHVKGKIRTT